MFGTFLLTNSDVDAAIPDASSPTSSNYFLSTARNIRQVPSHVMLSIATNNSKVTRQEVE